MAMQVHRSTQARANVRVNVRRTARPVAAGTHPIRIQLLRSGSANWDMTLPAVLGGASMRTNGGLFHGANWGAYGAHGGIDKTGTSPGANAYQFPTSIAAAVAEAVADHVQHVRLVGGGRWRGQYNNSPGADSEDDNAYASTHGANWQNLCDQARGLTNAAIWVTITNESDCGQAGTQDNPTKTFCGAFAGVGEVPMVMDDNGVWTVDPNFSTFATAGGYNYFTSPRMFNRLLQWWLMAAEEFRSYPYIFAYELLSEPLPSGGYTYDSTWSARIRSLLRVLIREIRRIDPTTPFLVGGRNAYNLSPEISEMILTERTDCIYTFDALDGGSSPAGSPIAFPGTGYTPNPSPHFKHPNRLQTFLALKVPGLQNQFGTKTVTGSDPNHWGFNAGYFVYKAYGIPCIYWNARDALLGNTDGTGYGWRYTTDAGLTWTDKAARIAFARARLTDTAASLKAAAITAMNAQTTPCAFWGDVFSGGQLAHTFVDAGVTPVSAAGQTSQQINPQLGTTMGNLFQNTSAARPVIKSTAVSDYLAASGDFGLVDGVTAWSFDAANIFLQALNNMFPLGTEDQTIIVACVPGNLAAIMDAFFCGNNTNGTAYPQLGLNASGVARARWTNTAGTNFDCIGTTILTDIPCVLTARKVGNSKQLFVNGIQEGASEATAMGATATTRTRIGGKPSGVSTWLGKIGYVFACTNGMSSSDQQAAERWGAYTVGAPYQL